MILGSWAYNRIGLLCLASLLDYYQVLAIIREQTATLNIKNKVTLLHTLRSRAIVSILEISVHLITNLVKFAQLSDNLTLLRNQFIFDFQIKLNEFVQINVTIIVFVTGIKNFIDNLLAMLLVTTTIEEEVMQLFSIKSTILVSINLLKLLLELAELCVAKCT